MLYCGSKCMSQQTDRSHFQVFISGGLKTVNLKAKPDPRTTTLGQNKQQKKQFKLTVIKIH